MFILKPRSSMIGIAYLDDEDIARLLTSTSDRTIRIGCGANVNQSDLKDGPYYAVSAEMVSPIDRAEFNYRVWGLIKAHEMRSFVPGALGSGQVLTACKVLPHGERSQKLEAYHGEVIVKDGRPLYDPGTVIYVGIMPEEIYTVEQILNRL